MSAPQPALRDCAARGANWRTADDQMRHRAKVGDPTFMLKVSNSALSRRKHGFESRWACQIFASNNRWLIFRV